MRWSKNWFSCFCWCSCFVCVIIFLVVVVVIWLKCKLVWRVVSCGCELFGSCCQAVDTSYLF